MKASALALRAVWIPFVGLLKRGAAIRKRLLILGVFHVVVAGIAPLAADIKNSITISTWHPTPPIVPTLDAWQSLEVLR